MLGVPPSVDRARPDRRTLLRRHHGGIAQPRLRLHRALVRHDRLSKEISVVDSFERTFIITVTKPDSALFSHPTSQPASGPATLTMQAPNADLFREPDYPESFAEALGEHAPTEQEVPRQRRDVRAGARRTTRRRTAA